MISLKNINKYYNKGRSNEIHVINNTSLDFPETGLVALTGPSGCGKTTLLNVIGGLDSFHSGEIVFDEKPMKRYNPVEWDVLRNEKVGYIFQNYNLVLSKTVYENIELALNMAGLYNKREIEDRINYVLKNVGMYNYRKRNVKALSGGQQQRVAIARALAKDPEVVLADEPTGNLDANNTFEIMSIIKKISESRLVILVTHERGLVDFYADRIIELADGKVVNDYVNTNSSGFDHVDERNIYLKDLNYDEGLKDSGIDYYYDHEKDPHLNVKLIELRGNLYIKVNSKRKIKYLDEDTEIRLIDDHYKKREISDLSENDFDLSQFPDIENGEKKKSFLKWKDVFKAGFKRVFSRRKFVGRLLLLGYFLISGLTVFLLASFGNATNVNDREFLNTPKEMLTLGPKIRLTSSQINEILDDIDGIELSPFLNTVFTRVYYNDYYQGNARASVSVYPVMSSYYDDVIITHGRMVESTTEIVIDEWVAEEVLASKSFTDLGITDFEGLIGSELTNNSYMALNYEIVGIAKTESPIVILDDEAIYGFYQSDFSDGLMSYGALKDRIVITEGSQTLTEDQIYVMNDGSSEIGDTIGLWGLGDKVVAGFYEPADTDFSFDGFAFIVHDDVYKESVINQIEEAFYYYEYTGVLFYADNPEQAIADFEAKGYDLYNSYDAAKEAFAEQQREDNATFITLLTVIIVGIVVYIFFMMRSSMLNRIKEIGVYRAIGASKKDIYKIFFAEIIALTTIASLSGYLISSYIVNALQRVSEDIINIFYFPIYMFIGGIVVIYLLNLVFGMLPIVTLLFKTPAQITSKYDI